MFNLQNPNTLAYYATMYEAQQAEADYSRAFQDFRDSGARAGSPQDYAVWSMAGYADVADRLIRTMPVWEA